MKIKNILLTRKRPTRKHKTVSFTQTDKGTGNGERDPELTETFLIGNLADLLFEIKRLAKVTTTTSSNRRKRNNISKLKMILGRYRTVLKSHFKITIGNYISDVFKSRKIENKDLHKIVVWWLKSDSKSNN